MVVAGLAVLSAVFRAMLSCTGAADSDPLSGISQVLHPLQAIMILLSRCAEGMPCCSWDVAVARRTLTFMRLSVRLSGEAAGGWFPDRWEGKRESCFRIYICGAFQAMPCPRPAMSYGICGMHLRTHSSNGLPMERLFLSRSACSHGAARNASLFVLVADRTLRKQWVPLLSGRRHRPQHSLHCTMGTSGFRIAGKQPRRSQTAGGQARRYGYATSAALSRWYARWVGVRHTGLAFADCPPLPETQEYRSSFLPSLRCTAT